METRLLKKQMTAAYQYSYTRLALNFETLLEHVSEQFCSEKADEVIRSLTGIMDRWSMGEEVKEELKALRNTVTHEVEILTSYTDAFQIYEYVLNRLERRFNTLPDTGYNDETFTSMLVKFITDTKDSAVMNTRIQEIVSQLPVRLTRQKFFSLVMEGLSVYKGSPREGLDGMMYTLRTESMASLPEDMAEGRRAIYEVLEQFRHMDFKGITKEVYEEAVAKLEATAMDLTDESGLYVLVQDIINDLFVLCLAGGEAVIDVKEEELYRSIILKALEKFKKEDFSAGDLEEVEELLVQLEGRQETYYERYLRSELPEATAELKADPDYVRAVNVDRLLSGSSFMELLEPEEIQSDGAEETDTALTDQAYLEETAGAFFKELENVFSTVSKPVMRAVMAKILSDLPVYFNSIDEIQNYIRGSFESCTDEAEKETCKELLEELMNYENNLV